MSNKHEPGLDTSVTPDGSPTVSSWCQTVAGGPYPSGLANGAKCLRWAKVLPLVLVGAPPTYDSLKARQRREAPARAEGWGGAYCCAQRWGRSLRASSESSPSGETKSRASQPNRRCSTRRLHCLPVQCVQTQRRRVARVQWAFRAVPRRLVGVEGRGSLVRVADFVATPTGSRRLAGR